MTEWEGAGRDTTAHADPKVIVGGWCGSYGRDHGAVRPPDKRVWEPGSHAFALVAKLAGFASHDICPECREKEQNDVDATPPGRSMERSARFTLYVTNAQTLRGQRHAEQARQLVGHLTQGTGTLVVVDVDAQPERADSAGIVETPTLVRYWPLLVARLHGHLDDEVQARRVFG